MYYFNLFLKHFYIIIYIVYLFKYICKRKNNNNKNKKKKINSEQVASSLFFKYNSALGPPYHVLVDTNFINFSIQNKLELVKSMMDCLYAKC